MKGRNGAEYDPNTVVFCSALLKYTPKYGRISVLLVKKDGQIPWGRSPDERTN